jgi:hypothetical protein
MIFSIIYYGVIPGMNKAEGWQRNGAVAMLHQSLDRIFVFSYVCGFFSILSTLLPSLLPVLHHGSRSFKCNRPCWQYFSICWLLLQVRKRKRSKVPPLALQKTPKTSSASLSTFVNYVKSYHQAPIAPAPVVILSQPGQSPDAFERLSGCSRWDDRSSK